MNFRSLYKIIYIFFNTKITFKSPKKSDLVVFDVKSLNDAKYFFDRYDFFLLETRTSILKKIYFSPKVIFHMIKNFYLGNIFTVYLISLIDIINPKVVLTKIDNAIKFSEIAKLRWKNYKFIAIQAAARYDYLYQDYFFKSKKTSTNFNEKIFIPHFFCFGDYEKEKFKELNLDIKNFYPIGDLQFSDYLEYKKNNIKINKKSDICFISDYVHKIFNHAYLGYDSATFKKFNDKNDIRNINIKLGPLKLLKYVLKYAKDKNLKLEIPLKRDPILNPDLSKIEIDFFKENLSTKEFQYFKECVIVKNRAKYTSLESVFNSKVVVGWASTLLRNKIGIGGKALSCNFIKDKLYDFPIKGICHLEDCSYQEFDSRMNEIIKISEKEFQKKIDKETGYVMKFNEHISTSDVLAKKISEFGVHKKE